MQSTNAKIITFNVGGQKFQTTKSTISRSDFLVALIKWNESENISLNENSSEIFVDRNPENFREIKISSRINK